MHSSSTQFCGNGVMTFTVVYRSHQAPNELIKPKLKQLILDTLAPLMLYRRKGILDHYNPISTLTGHSTSKTDPQTHHTQPRG